jgi:hypothetical protein
LESRSAECGPALVSEEVDRAPLPGRGQTRYVYTDSYLLYPTYGVGTRVKSNAVCADSAYALPNGGGHSVCGTISSTDVSTGLLFHMYRAIICNGIDGASGGAFYLNNLGFGIMSSRFRTCDAIYQPLPSALIATQRASVDDETCRPNGLDSFSARIYGACVAGAPAECRRPIARDKPGSTHEAR